MNEVYKRALMFKSKYPSTIAWRLKKHCDRIEEHLNPNEKVLYVFTGQKNDKFYDIISTAVFAITDKRLIIANDRVVFGYFLYSITPDMFNDLTVVAGPVWGRVIIDTIKEEVVITNISKRALDEIETNVTEYMMEQKKQYGYRENQKRNKTQKN